MADRCDVVVVGAGPSGLMASWKLAEKGFKVILLETKKTAYRYKRPCCAMVILEPGFHSETVKTGPGKIMFENTGLEIPYKGEFNNLNRSIKFSPSGYKFLVKSKTGYPLARTISKEALLKTFYDKALEAGVEIREGESGIGAECRDESVEIRVRKEEKTYKINASYAVAADGVNSAVLESLGLNKGRKFYFKTQVIAYHFEDVDCPYPDAFMDFRGTSFCASSGGVWLTPKPNKSGKLEYEVSFAFDSSKGEKGKKLLDSFLARNYIKPWFKNARLTTVNGCVWTLRAPIKDSVFKRVLIAGDAGAFQEVENQGAIMCGYRAAEAISLENQGKNGFDGYRKFWINSFEFNDEKVLYDTAMGFGLRYLGDDELDFIFSVFDNDELPGTINHFTVGKQMLAEIAKKMDFIKSKRPDIATKLVRFTSQKVEDYFK